MKSIRLKSPAKLNLLLKVVNRRKDGYHNLVTVFERISLCDDIMMTVNKTGVIRVRSRNRDLPKGPKNLVYRVAKLLQKEFTVPLGVDVKINKRIPIAAGLGGGSSNAATAFLGLNKIWNLRLTRRQLVGYAEKIGSDVPFFLHDYSWGLGTERGNKIKKISLKTKLWHILIVPRIKVYSREVFGALKLPGGRFLSSLTPRINPLKGGGAAPTNILTASDATGEARGLMQYLPVVRPRASGGPKGRPLTQSGQPKAGPAVSIQSAVCGQAGGTNILTKARDDVNIFTPLEKAVRGQDFLTGLTRALRKNDLPRIGSLLSNDLETTIVRLHPNLSKIKEKLETLGALGVVFSGSGPAVFGLVRSSRQARALKAILNKKYAQVFAVRTL